MKSTTNIEVLVIHKEGIHEVAVLAAGTARDVVLGQDEVTPAEAAATVVDAYLAAVRKLAATPGATS